MTTMRTFKLTLLLFFTCFCFFSCASKPKSEEIQTKEEVEETTENVILDEEEYLRSTHDLSSEDLVSIKEFSDDKAEILKIIDELKVIMEEEDFESWLNYIAPDSITYYSNPVNIRKAQRKLPDKTIVLNGIKDYFKYVFIPSRKRSQVDEIRYISKKNIKAVDVRDDSSIIVYYQFVKIDGKWLVHIPSL